MNEPNVTLFDVPVNYSVPTADQARLKGQAKTIYALLATRKELNMPVTNDELSRIGLKYTGRISERRKLLEKKYNLTIVATRVNGGLFNYMIEKLE